MKSLTLLLALSIPLLSQTTTVPVLTPSGLDPTGTNDSGAAIRAALAATVSGTFYLPAGTYKVTSTITTNRNQMLRGAGVLNTVLNCTMTSTPCLVIADNTLGSSNYGITTLNEIGLLGPVSGNAGSVGVYLGGDPAGVISPSNSFADYVNLVSVRIAGFYSGVQFGNNAYVNKFERDAIAGNTQGIYYPTGLSNSGEAVSITDTDIFNNSTYGLNLPGGGEWFITGTSFDYNSTEAITLAGGTMMINHTHFEENTAPIITGQYGYSNVSIQDSEFLVQGSTAATDIFDFYFAGVNLTLNHLNVYSNAAITGLIRFAPGSTVVAGTIQNVAYNSNIANLGTVPYSYPDLIVSNNGVSGGKVNFGCDTSQGTALLNLCGLTAQTPVDLDLLETTYGSGSYHAALQIGTGWLLEQDTASNGTRDFALRSLLNSTNPIAVNAAGTTVTVSNLTVTGTCTGCGGGGSSSVSTTFSASATTGTLTHSLGSTAHIDQCVNTSNAVVLPTTLTIGSSADSFTFSPGLSASTTCTATGGGGSGSSVSNTFSSAATTGTLTHNFGSTSHIDQCVNSSNAIVLPTTLTVGSTSDSFTFSGGLAASTTCTATH